MKDKKINIYISGKGDFYYKKSSLFIPVRIYNDNSVKVGDKLLEKNNIVSQNYQHFNMLSVMEWAYNNDVSDYYGFLNSKNYFILKETNNTFYDCMCEGVFESIGVDEKTICKECEKYDVILSDKIELFYSGRLMSVEEFYDFDIFFNTDDLKRCIDIVNKLFPNYKKDIREVLHQTWLYRFNEMIMKNEVFSDYCNFLFPVLHEFDNGRDYKEESKRSQLVTFMLGEFLLNVFIRHHPKLKIKERKVAFFANDNDPYLSPLNNNKIGICFACDDIYAKHTGIALQSIIEKSSGDNFYDVIILDNKISQGNKNLLEETVQNRGNFSLRFLSVSSYVDGLDLNIRDYCNVSTYLRFVIFDLLRKFEKIIYLDGDIIVNTDIAKMYDIDLGDNYAAASRDFPMASRIHMHNHDGVSFLNYLKDVIGLKIPSDYFCAGIMIFNVNRVIKDFTTKDLFDLALSKKWMYQDQDVLNYLFKEKMLLLPLKWDCFAFDSNVDEGDFYSVPLDLLNEYLEAKKDPYIVHYAGQMQPFNHPSVYNPNLFWNVAKKSPFYHNLIMETVIKNLANHADNSNKSSEKKSKLKKILTRILPPNTFVGRVSRKLFKKIRGH